MLATDQSKTIALKNSFEVALYAILIHGSLQSMFNHVCKVCRFRADVSP